MEKETIILVVDDEAGVLELVGLAFRKEGYRVIIAKDGKHGLDNFKKFPPDLVVLDIMMPGMDGIEVCRRIRSESRYVPIIFLTSKDDDVDKIVGLELGADDYITKPFNPRELLARVRAVLRLVDSLKNKKESAADEERHIYECGKLKLDTEKKKAYWGTKEVYLTAIEFGIMKAMAASPQKVCSRKDLMHKGYNMEINVSDRTIDSHIRCIRNRFRNAGGDPIETVRSFGYKLSSCA